MYNDKLVMLKNTGDFYTREGEKKGSETLIKILPHILLTCRLSFYIVIA